MALTTTALPSRPMKSLASACRQFKSVRSNKSKRKAKNGSSAHQSAQMKNDEWLTPPEIVAKPGSFDLDPCSPINRPWPTAGVHYTVLDDGLSQPWHGRVVRSAIRA